MSMNEQKGILTVISGFSGAGKGTVLKRLLTKYDNYALSISATTRAPREGEENGREYFFKTREEFEKMIAKGELIEYAMYVNNYYGTPKAYVQEQLSQGKDVILEIEVQGALKIKERFPDALLIFITPPSAGELKRRLTDRGTEAPEVVEERMRTAARESGFMEAYDYIILNERDRLEECVDKVHGVISAEHARSTRSQAFIEHMKEDLKGE